MYPRIAILATADGKKAVFGTYNKSMTAEEGKEHLKEKWYGETEVDVLMVTCIPDDGYPYWV